MGDKTDRQITNQQAIQCILVYMHGSFFLFGVKYYSLCKLSLFPFSLSSPQDDVPSQQPKDLTLAAAHIEDAKTGRSVCSIIASCKNIAT